MNDEERISPLSFRIKYLKTDLVFFSVVLCGYIFILTREKSHAGIERIIWIVDRVGAAIPVGIVLTLFFELGGLGIVWLTNWYRESYKAKREEELAAAKEQGRREGRAELQAELEAAQAELDDEPTADTGSNHNSDE